MTSRSCWKNSERTVARALGSERNPLSGMNSGHSTSDTLHPELYIEVKTRKKVPFRKLLIDTIKKAFVENKIPILVYHELSQKREDDMVMMRFADFAHMYDCAKKSKVDIKL